MFKENLFLPQAIGNLQKSTSLNAESGLLHDEKR